AVPSGGPMAGPRGFLAASRSEGRSPSPFGLVVSVIARPSFGPPLREALLPTPVGAGRFVIRATHERGVGVPSSRSLATASREAMSLYGNNRRFESCRGH